MEPDAQFEQLMTQLWKIDALPKPSAENLPYAGSAQKVYQLSGKDTYVKDIHGTMVNEEHPMKGSNKFEWEAPPYTYEGWRYRIEFLRRRVKKRSRRLQVLRAIRSTR